MHVVQLKCILLEGYVSLCVCVCVCVCVSPQKVLQNGKELDAGKYIIGVTQ